MEEDRATGHTSIRTGRVVELIAVGGFRVGFSPDFLLLNGLPKWFLDDLRLQKRPNK